MSTTDEDEIRARYASCLQELYCDFAAGDYAGKHDARTRFFEDYISKTPGGNTHPEGRMRLLYYTAGKELSSSDPLRRFVPSQLNPGYQRRKAELLDQLQAYFTEEFIP